MWAVLALVGAGMVAMVALHMRVRRHKAMDVSAAAFLLKLVDTRQPKFRWSLSAPLASALFWLRMTMLFALLLAVLTVALPALWLTQDSRSMGVWVIVDQSYSMSGRARGGGTLIEAARAEARAAIEAGFAHRRDGVQTCAFVWALGQKLSPVVEGTGRDPILADLDRVVPIPESASFALVGKTLREPARAEKDPACKPTHVVVISDQPDPRLPDAGPGETKSKRPVLLWRQVEADPANVGIAGVAANGGGMWDAGRSGSGQGGLSGVSVSLTPSPGGAPAPKVSLSGPKEGGGRYEARIEPGDSYAGDDRVAFDYVPPHSGAVDWRLAGDGAARLHLRQSAGPEAVAVESASAARAGRRRTLLVGAGYSGAPVEIGLFVNHPLLEAVNLDVFEQAGPAPAPQAVAADPGFRPLIQDKAGRVLVAVRESPKAVYVPGIPGAMSGAGVNDPKTRAAAVLFFNALRWLDDQPSRIEPDYLTPEGEVIQGGAREWTPPSGPPTLDPLTELKPVAVEGKEGWSWLWRWFVVAALAAFAAERWLAARREE